MKIGFYSGLTAAFSLPVSGSCLAVDSQPDGSSDWPEGKSLAAAGKRVAKNLLPRKF